MIAQAISCTGHPVQSHRNTLAACGASLSNCFTLRWCLLFHTYKYLSICIQIHVNTVKYIIFISTFSFITCFYVLCLCLRNIAAVWPCRLGLVWHSLQPPQWVQLASPHRPSWPRPTRQCTSMWEDRCTPAVSLRSLNTQNLGKTCTRSIKTRVEKVLRHRHTKLHWDSSIYVHISYTQVYTIM